MNFRRSLIIAELWRPEVARCWKKSFFAFFSTNDFSLEYFQNYVPKGFIATPIDVLCLNFVKFGRREIGKVVHYLPDKKQQKFASLSSLLRGSRPKSARASPTQCTQECSWFHPNGFTFGEVTYERVNTVRPRSKVNPIFGWSLASSQTKTCFDYYHMIIIRFDYSTVSLL